MMWVFISRIKVTGLLIMLLSIDLSAQTAFVEITGAALPLEESRNSGIAFYDINNDGWEDIYVSARDGANKLYLNRGDRTFRDISEAAGVGFTGDTRTSVIGDLNNDGHAEIYLGNAETADILYMNNGDGTFEDISVPAGIDNPHNTFSVQLADFDEDGLLDIYVANLSDENVLYRNNGDMTFTDITAASGAVDDQLSMGAVAFDYDLDGDIDLYLTHDGKVKNILYANAGDGTFTDVSASAGVDYAGFGMGVDAGDFNNDGWPDLYITNLYENVLYLNNTDGTFTNIAGSAGVDDYGMGWGCAFVDYDNDGLKDIYVANDSWFSPYPNVLYHNKGDLTFDIVEAGGPVSSMLGTYAAAAADIDQDGYTDVMIANTDTDQSCQLFRNMGSEGNWITFRLEGLTTNRDAIGARIEVTDNAGVTRSRQVIAGSGFAAQNTLVQHFGLGTADTIRRLVVIWPSGLAQMLQNIPAGCHYTLQEGGGLKTTGDCLTTAVEHVAAEHAHLSVWPNPSNGVFYLQAMHPHALNGQIRIFSVAGQVLKTCRITGQPTRVEFNAKPGLYFIESRIGGSTRLDKLIVK